MKPINFKDSNCESTSSNCVIWQGENISCLQLCNGDSITKVVYDLAIEFCKIKEQLNLENYELGCLSTLLGTNPDFTALMNLLIFKICTLENIEVPNPAVAGALSDCPNCVVNLAEYFYYPDPSNGDIVTKDLVQNYVQKIGIAVSNIVQQVAIAQRADTSLNERVSALENTPPPVFTLPQLYPTGIASPNVLLPLDEFVALLEQQFVAFREAVGDTTEIYNAITTFPSDFNSARALGTSGGVMGTLPGWITDPQNLSEYVVNMSLTILDLRSAVRSIQLQIQTACEGIEIAFSATLENKILKLFFNGSIPNNLDNCEFQGSLFRVADDSGNWFNTRVDVKSNMNNESGVVVDLNSTTLNFADDLKVTSIYCVTDVSTATTCERYLEAYVNNNLNCPTLNVIPSTNSVTYSWTHTTGTLTYSVQLFDDTNTMIQSQNFGASSPAVFSGVFSSLDSVSLYRIRIAMITASNTKTCPFVAFNTLPAVCPAPNVITAVIEQ